MRKRARMSTQILWANARRKCKLQKKLEVLEYKLIESHKREEKAKEQKAINTIKTNSRYFFAYAKSKSKVKVPIGPLEDQGNFISDPKRVSQILQNQFQSVFSQPVFNQTELDLLTLGRTQEFCNIDITEMDIEDAIKQVSSGAAPGPDGIPPVLLKECSMSLKKPICMLWNKSMETGQIPDELKLGLIIPVHKSGSRGEAKNYRPITLTSHLIKVFERVMVKKLVQYLENNNLFNDRQHGFRRNRSCLSQLMDHYQRILNIMETGDSADVIYLDFAKAFDKVDHGILLRKLVKIGVGGPALIWINKFLTNRMQVVKVEDSLSCGAPVISGVPQGTVLGPILFLIFVGDIDDDLKHAEASSFADDTRVVMQVGNQSEADHLQGDLNTLYQWTRDNNMEFNSQKFQHLRYAPNQSMTSSYNAPGNNNIEMTEHLRDLGITMSSNGNFEQHINSIAQKGNQMSGWILRSFATRNPFPMMTLFKALVLPIIEYCCQMWSPKKQYLIKKIEDVQRHFTAKLNGTDGLKYRQRLKLLMAYSLERRRDRYTVMYVWKIIQGLAPNLLGNDKIQCNESNQRLGRYCILPSLNRTAPNYVQTLRENSFSVYGPRLFNELPRQIRNFDGSLDTFKRKLDEYLMGLRMYPMILQNPALLLATV